MLMKELLLKIEESYHKYFPDSKCHVYYSSNLYRSIGIVCHIANDKNECAHGYWDNDMLSVSFSIDTERGEFPKGTSLESELYNLCLKNYNKSYLIKPNTQYLVYERRQLKFRKTTGNAEKLINSLDKFFLQLQTSLIEDYKNDALHSNHVELVREKLSL